MSDCPTQTLDHAVTPVRQPIRWTDISSWHPQMTSVLNNLLRPGAVNRLNEVEDHDLYDDDSEWFELALGEFPGDEETFLELISQALEAYCVRTFHGTRTADARSFINGGIRLHNRAELENYVRSLVAKHNCLHAIAGTLDDRFAGTAHLIDEGRCFVVVDERVLIEECGHYLLGGSEFVQGILGPHVVQAMLSESSPTVVEVNLPLLRVTPSQLREFAKKIVGEWTRILRRDPFAVRRLDFSFCLQEPVAASWVVGHFHPPVVNDPHNRRRPVPTRQAYCAACKDGLSEL